MPFTYHVTRSKIPHHASTTDNGHVSPPMEISSSSFARWCESHAYVECKISHRSVPFKLYPCQQRVAALLEQKKWLWILKARRLGLTWLLAAYATWLLTEHENRTVLVLNQSKDYAQDFLDRMRSILERLPEDQRPKITRNNKTLLSFDNGSSVRSLACTRRAIRSVSADLVVFDEAAYMDLLKDARKAAQPAVEMGNGQVVAISTSSGPSGEFYEIWHQAASGKARYMPVFLDWRELKSRDEKWYEREASENQSDPLYMKREYPSSAEEAFESAEGRVYPLFIRSDKFIRQCVVDPLWTKYRALDFGGVDPFVCLWGAIIPGDGPGLTVDPHCANLIREMLAYCYDAHGSPADKHNHACDALRYMIATPPIAGHLHIYREMYIPNSAAKGYSLDDLRDQILLLSGDEQFKDTICDAARPDLIGHLSKKYLPSIPYRQLTVSNNSQGQIVQGIVYVNQLIVGTAKNVQPEPRKPHGKIIGLPDDIRWKGLYRNKD